jgi:transposase
MVVTIIEIIGYEKGGCAPLHEEFIDNKKPPVTTSFRKEVTGGFDMERIVIRLHWRVKGRIRQIVSRTNDANLRNRCRIVLLYGEGLGCNRIADKVGCAPATAIRVAQRFLAYGFEALEDGRKNNGYQKVDADLEEALIQAIGKTPQDFGYMRSTWTRELLVRVLGAMTGVQISQRTVDRIFKRLKIRWGRPRPIVKSRVSRIERARREKEIKKILRTIRPYEVVVYEDEVDIHLNPKIGPDWMLSGNQKKVLTPGKNQKNFIAGALNARTGQLTWVQGDRKNSVLFIELLGELRRTYRSARRIHIILDNYIIHSSKRTQMALEAFGTVFVLHFLPPYTPELNEIEKVWKQLHANVTRNHQCRTMKELMRNVRKFLKNASPFPGSKPALAKIARKYRLRKTA